MTVWLQLIVSFGQNRDLQMLMKIQVQHNDVQPAASALLQALSLAFPLRFPRISRYFRFFAWQ